MSPSIQQMRSYTWLKRHLPKEVVLEVMSLYRKLRDNLNIKLYHYSDMIGRDLGKGQ